MARKNYDFQITQQVSERIALEILDDVGTPRDLSGYQFKLACKKNYTDPQTIFQLSSMEATIQLDSVHHHNLYLDFKHELTKTLAFDRGVYDLLAFLPDKSSVELLMGGTVSLHRTVTSLD